MKREKQKATKLFHAREKKGDSLACAKQGDTMAYKQTEVSSYKSQEQIKAILMKNGVRGVQFAEDFETRIILVKFAKVIDGNLVTIRIQMQVPQAKQSNKTQVWSRTERRYIPNKSNAQRQQQLFNATYRALHYWLKSQFEAVEFGLLTFEDIFLSHFEWMMPDGTAHTIGEIVRPMITNPSMLLTATTGEIVEEG